MAKERIRATQRGQVYTPERTVNFESRLAHRAQDVMDGRPLLDGPLRVDLEIRMPIPKSKSNKFKADALAGRERPTKKPDYDNFAKMLDALNMIVWVDDSQIVDGRQTKVYSDSPGFIVEVRELNRSVFE